MYVTRVWASNPYMSWNTCTEWLSATGLFWFLSPLTYKFSGTDSWWFGTQPHNSGFGWHCGGRKRSVELKGPMSNVHNQYLGYNRVYQSINEPLIKMLRHASCIIFVCTGVRVISQSKKGLHSSTISGCDLDGIEFVEYLSLPRGMKNIRTVAQVQCHLIPHALLVGINLEHHLVGGRLVLLV